jgi:hypothetical protein
MRRSKSSPEQCNHGKRVALLRRHPAGKRGTAAKKFYEGFRSQPEYGSGASRVMKCYRHVTQGWRAAGNAG